MEDISREKLKTKIRSQHRKRVTTKNDCAQSCAISFAATVAVEEAIFIGALVACGFTGPGVALCVAMATGGKYASIATAVYGFASCVSNCPTDDISDE